MQEQFRIVHIQTELVHIGEQLRNKKQGADFVFFFLSKACQMVSTGWREKGSLGNPHLDQEQKHRGCLSSVGPLGQLLSPLQLFISEIIPKHYCGNGLKSCSPPKTIQENGNQKEACV